MSAICLWLIYKLQSVALMHYFQNSPIKLLLQQKDLKIRYMNITYVPVKTCTIIKELTSFNKLIFIYNCILRWNACPSNVHTLPIITLYSINLDLHKFSQLCKSCNSKFSEFFFLIK